MRPSGLEPTTMFTHNKALNLVHGCKIRPPVFRSSVLCGFRDAWDVSDELTWARDGSRIDAFLDHFAPVFNPDNVEPSSIERALSAQASLHNQSVGETRLRAARTHMRGPARRLASAIRLIAGEFNAYDVHLVAAAVARNANVICSANCAHLSEAEAPRHHGRIAPSGAALGQVKPPSQNHDDAANALYAAVCHEFTCARARLADISLRCAVTPATPVISNSFCK
jgi:hypothetical protein